MKELGKPLSVIVKYLSATFALLYLYLSGPGSVSSAGEVGYYILFTNVLCLILYPANKKNPNNKLLKGIDSVFVILTVASVGYWIFQYHSYAIYRVGMPNNADLAFGVVMILLSLETTRRVLGNTLPILGIIFLAILFLGPYLPGVFQHKGFSLTRIIEFNYSTREGIFGTVANVFAVYVMPFLIFGSFLQKSGGGDFFIDLAKGIAGRFPGGPALISVWISCFFAMISGSPIANVMTTGTFTIPMMKRMGFKPEFAASVEAAASTGGQFMPPLMGAGAFLMATLTETPYHIIMVMALVPALLYYLSLTTAVYFWARRNGFEGIPRKDLPVVSEVLRKGWYYLLSLVMVTGLLLYGFSVPMTAFGSTIFLIACSVIRKKDRMTLSTFIKTLEDAARSSLMVGATAGTLGLVMGGITLSGIGLKFSAAILSLSHGSLFFSIILVGIVGTILGMGLPTTAAYIVMAIMAAPALIQMGLPPINAHFICFWLSMASNVTPPVALAAYAASGIAGSDAMKTGVNAFILAIYLYVMPFAFAFAPEITVLGHGFIKPFQLIVSFSLATIALGGVTQGWLLVKLKNWERVILGLITVLLITPELLTDLIGLGAFAGIITILWRKKGKINKTNRMNSEQVAIIE